MKRLTQMAGRSSAAGIYIHLLPFSLPPHIQIEAAGRRKMFAKPSARRRLLGWRHRGNKGQELFLQEGVSVVTERPWTHLGCSCQFDICLFIMLANGEKCCLGRDPVSTGWNPKPPWGRSDGGSIWASGWRLALITKVSGVLNPRLATRVAQVSSVHC